MAKFESPWIKTLSGPWTEQMERSQKQCHYCRRPAAMKEPGTPWWAHKVCAEEGPEAARNGRALGDWDGEEHKLAEDRPLGCGTYPEGARSGRYCAGTGAQLSCQLCPRSPSYWKLAHGGLESIEFFGHITD